MARTWAAKAPAEIVERRWAAPLAAGDGISTVSTSASGVTVDSDDYELGEAVVILSGGTAGATGSVTVTVTTTDAQTHVETFYIPIHATTAQTVTARDICDFALRKIVGVGNEAEANEQSDALELLQGVFAKHSFGPVPLTAATELSVPDDFVLPLKYILRKLAHSTYEAPLTLTDEQMADWGDRYLSNALFAPSDLPMPTTIARSSESAADLF